jgi:hypothetical protein
LPFWAKYCNNFLLFYGLCLEVIVRRDW